MAGYAARTEPARGTYRDLFAKALCLEDDAGNRSVLVTMDVLGFSADFIGEVSRRIEERSALRREQLFFNASHTHSGPALTGVLEIAYDMTPQQIEDVAVYTRELQDKVVDLVEDAVDKLAPVKVHYGKSSAPFAINRRVKTAEGFVIGANRAGPVDHDVPVLTVDTDDGGLAAVVFGYSCHNTTLQGSNYHYHGDYAGTAQAWLEERYPGAVALFVTGTAGDSNPYPRGTRDLAEEHGATLGQAVAAAITGPMAPVDPRLSTRLDTVGLEFRKPKAREEWEKLLEDENPFKIRHARYMLRMLDERGSIKTSYDYPVQTWRLGNDLILIGLAGEVVIDYSIRLRRELAGMNVWVAGYSNDVFAYVPSVRILREGGYEAEESMIYYGQPGPFEESVEEKIITTVHRMLRETEE